MATQETLHVTPLEGGEWAVSRGEGAPPASVHPTEGLAIASVYELVPEPGEAEVVVHGPGGAIRSSMRISRLRPSFEALEARGVPESLGPLDDLDDPAARAEALRITPSTGRLVAGAARRLPVEGADLEADPADLY